jgi:hypothetical protein
MYWGGELIIFTYTDVANLHNRIDDVPLTAGAPDLEEDPVAAYLGYYDWSTPQQSYWVGLWSSLFWDILYMASDIGVTYSFV